MMMKKSGKSYKHMELPPNSYWEYPENDEIKRCDSSCGHFDGLNLCCWICPPKGGLFTDVSEGDVCFYGFKEGSYE